MWDRLFHAVRTRRLVTPTLIDRLEDFRWRLLRSFAYIAVAAVVCWFLRQSLMALALWPMRQAAELAGLAPKLQFKIFELTGGLILSMQIAVAAGVILASPLWFLELFGLVEPLLAPEQRKSVAWLLPTAVLLFLTGAGFCYWMTPHVCLVLLHFQHGLLVAPEFILQSYLRFFLGLVVFFGAMFEMPLVLMFLASIGVVSSQMLARQWRIAVIAIMVATAFATHLPDPITLSFLQIPVIGLYVLSIYLAKLVERRRDTARAVDA